MTASREVASIGDESSSVAVVSAGQLQAAPSLAVDDALRTVAGFQLFRRTSSWTANPTSSGVSLRGLGSTAASRTLVISDEVPANDAFGGWVHWDEIPNLAVSSVDLLRGGASDVYGSSAIGGVIDIVPRTATNHRFVVETNALGATENTGGGDALVGASAPHLGSAIAAFSALSNGGYITTAPADRGPIDIPTNVADEAGRVELRTPQLARSATLFLRGNVLNEARVNGTPLQNNALRLWRYAGGADVQQARSTETLRVFGSREGYRQAFSSVLSVAGPRDSEKLTKLQRVPSDDFGAVVQAARTLPRGVLALAGVDLRDTRATDAETTPASGVTTDTSARQREVGGFLDASLQWKSWAFSGSVRVDSFRTFDARQTATNAATIAALPSIHELVANPHVGVVRHFRGGIALSAAMFRAFRGPTLNELYRTSQVGQQLTLANDQLLAERATGGEAGVTIERKAVRMRAVYFDTEVNRAISAILLTSTPTSQTLQRQNLGQIRSRGMMAEAETAKWHNVSGTFGYQLAIATVTAFRSDSPAQTSLLGNRLPEVPRESTTAAINWTPKFAAFHVYGSYQGLEYDDAANQFPLHPYARFDISAERILRGKISLYAGAQNLLDRAIETGRTPILTLAPPRLVEAGVRFRFQR